MGTESEVVEILDVEDLTIRVLAVERDIGLVRQEFDHGINNARQDFGEVVEQHTVALQRIGDKIEMALNYQKDSLPIGLVMKLFTFFSGLIIVLLGAILGIKWVSTEILDHPKFPGIVKEQLK